MRTPEERAEIERIVRNGFLKEEDRVMMQQLTKTIADEHAALKDLIKRIEALEKFEEEAKVIASLQQDCFIAIARDMQRIQLQLADIARGNQRMQ